uniref:Uncharacterized protein n=1 Tax=Phasianus colchicus TaxID=9054 RepID=A0A669QCB1_PHACC
MAAAAAPPGAGCSPAGGGSVPVLFCFSVFARPSTVPHGAGYELLIQKFLSLYGDQIDIHRKFVVQLFAEEWSQYIDLPKGFVVSERCKVRLVPLQIQVRASPAPTAATGVGGRPRPAVAAFPGRVEPPSGPLPAARARATGESSLPDPVHVFHTEYFILCALEIHASHAVIVALGATFLFFLSSTLNNLTFKKNNSFNSERAS